MDYLDFYKTLFKAYNKLDKFKSFENLLEKNEYKREICEEAFNKIKDKSPKNIKWIIKGIMRRKAEMPDSHNIEYYLKDVGAYDISTIGESNIPNDLKEEYEQAKKWYDLKVGNTSWWYDQGYLFWKEDLTYAYNEALKKDIKMNGEKYGQYSANGKYELSKEVKLCLFVRNKDYECLFGDFLNMDTKKIKTHVQTSKNVSDVISDSVNKVPNDWSDKYVPEF